MANITKSASKTLTAPVSGSAKFTLTAKLEETSYDIINNTSTIKVTASIKSGQWDFIGSSQHSLKIYWYDNNSYTGGTSSTKAVTSIGKNQTITIEKIITNVPHNAATGILKGYAKAVWIKSGSNQYAPSSGNIATAETALTTIPRNPSFTTNPTIVSTSETGFTIDRGVTNILSNFSYSIKIKNTSTPLPIAPTIPAGGTTVTYSGLDPDTDYVVTITAQNSANTSLITNKDIDVRTWAYPSITGVSAQTLTPGNTQTIILNNPHNRNVSWYMRMDTTTTSGGSSVISGTSSSSSISFTPLIDTLFSVINGLGTTRTSINVCYYIVYDNQYSILSSSPQTTVAITEAAYKPVWNNVPANEAILYKDTDSVSAAVTGDGQILVTGKSKIKYAKSPNYTATPNRSAILRYEMSLDGTNYTTIVGDTFSPIDPQEGVLVDSSATSIKIYLRAIDSRGYKSDPLIRTISGDSLKPYALPTATISAQRRNGFGDIVELRINPTWSISSTNNRGVAYWAYKQGTGTTGYSGEETITDYNVDSPLPGNYDNSKTYTFRVRLVDVFGGSSGYLYTTIGPGTTIMFIDATMQSVGINCFPASGYKLDIAGSAHIQNKIVIDGPIQKNRYAVVGQTSNTAGNNTWYKFASIDVSETDADKNIWFKVYSGYGDNSTALGELMAHFRTESNRSIGNNRELQWTSCGIGIDLSNFKMAYFNDNTGEHIVAKVELWANVTNSGRRYKFVVQAEGTIDQEKAGEWTLYQTKAAAGEAAPTEDYTLVDSTLLTLQNSISGSVNSAINADSAYKITAPEGTRISSADINHSYISNRATKRIDAATSSMSESKPVSDGFIETFFWDNSSAYDAQLYIPNNDSRLQIRTRNNGTSWPSTWKSIAYYDDIPTLPVETSWTNISLKSGISVGSYAGTPQWKRVGNQIFLRGSYAGTKVAGTSLILGTIPEGYRPHNNVYEMASVNGSKIGRVYISDTGNIGVDWIYSLDSSEEWEGSFTWLAFELSYWID